MFIFLPDNTKLYYADETIDNFYKGYHSSASYLHEKNNHNDWTGTYSHLVQSEGLQGGTHVYRLRERKFFNLLKTKEKTRWYGGTIWNYSYIQPQVLKAGFTFVEYSDNMREFGEDQYFIFDDNPQTVRLRDLYEAHFSKARIPTIFMRDVLQRIKIFNEKKGSLIKFVEKRLQDEAKGSSK